MCKMQIENLCGRFMNRLYEKRCGVGRPPLARGLVFARNEQMAGGENISLISPSVSCADSSLIRGSPCGRFWDRPYGRRGRKKPPSRVGGRQM